MPHSVLRKWLFVESTHEDFEATMTDVAICIEKNDPRFGVYSKPRKKKASTAT